MAEEKPLAIAIFTDSFTPQVNGVVTSVINTTRILADKGHKIFIIAPAYPDLEEYTYPGVTVYRVPSVPAGFYPDFFWTSIWDRGVKKLILSEKIDVIHFMTPITVSMIGILLGKKYNLPIIGTFHTFITDPTYFKQLFKFTSPPFAWLAKKIVHLFYNKADLVTAPSVRTNNELTRLGVKPPKKYISNGIDLNKFDNSKSKDIRKKYNLTGKTILYVGRVSHEKNFNVLMEGFYKANKKLPEAKLLIVGHGPIWDQIKKEVENRSLSDSVIFTGAIPYDELIASGIFGAVEVFATAAKTENQPMTILEAQANGLVCLGPDARGIPDLIHNDINGIIVPPDDTDALAEAMVKLLTDKKLYSRMKKETKKEIKEHDIFRCAQLWVKTYREEMDQKGKPTYEK
jgi:1,2-diacylglycerol 3-alpha-glucosyltransferase